MDLRVRVRIGTEIATKVRFTVSGCIWGEGVGYELGLESGQSVGVRGRAG